MPHAGRTIKAPPRKRIATRAWRMRRTKAWKSARLRHLRDHPLCVRCEELGYVEAADTVHHVQALADGGSLTDPSNLMSLCRRCHGVVEGLQKKKRGLRHPP